MGDLYRRIAATRARVQTITELRSSYSDEAVRRRVRAGAWRRLHRGVYLLISDAPTWLERVVAAVLAVGAEDAVVCGPTAAELWGFEGAGSGGRVHLATEAASGRKSLGRGTVIHQLDSHDAGTVTVAGIRITAPLRTVVDCARSLSPHQAVVVIESGIRSRAFTHTDVVAAVGSLQGGRGVVQARAALLRVDLRSESGLETECRLLLVDAGLPPTSLQRVVVEHDTAYRLDLAYDHVFVGIEVDGRAGRETRARFVGDRRRQNAILRHRTWLVLRFTAWDIRRDPAYVVQTVREALAASAAA